jgi:hypothetical protein
VARAMLLLLLLLPAGPGGDPTCDCWSMLLPAAAACCWWCAAEGVPPRPDRLLLLPGAWPNAPVRWLVAAALLLRGGPGPPLPAAAAAAAAIAVAPTMLPAREGARGPDSERPLVLSRSMSARTA